MTKYFLIYEAKSYREKVLSYLKMNHTCERIPWTRQILKPHTWAVFMTRKRTINSLDTQSTLSLTT